MTDQYECHKRARTDKKGYAAPLARVELNRRKGVLQPNGAASLLAAGRFRPTTASRRCVVAMTACEVQLPFPFRRIVKRTAGRQPNETSTYPYLG